MVYPYLAQESKSKHLENLFWLHILGISLGLRVDQIFGIFTLFLTLAIIYYYFKTKNLYLPRLPLPLFVIVGYFLALWLVSIFVQYYAFEWDLWDTGIHTNNITYFVQAKKYFSSVLDKNALQDHFTIGLLILSPLFLLKSTVIWPLALRLLAFALSLIFLNKALQILFPKKEIRALLIFFWLLHYGISKTLAAEFHGSSLSPLFLFMAFYFLLKQKPFWVFTYLAVMCLFKENMVLGFFCFSALYGLYFRKIKHSLIFLILGVIFTLGIYYSVFWITGGYLQQTNKWGPFLFLDKKLGYVWHLLFTFLFIPLLNLKLLVVFLISTSASLLSNYPLMLKLNFHYQDIPSTIGMICTVLVIKEIYDGKNWAWQKFSHIAKPVMAVSFLWANHFTPAQIILNHLPKAVHIKLHREISKLKKEIPQNTVLAIEPKIAQAFMEYPFLAPLLASEIKELTQGKIPEKWQEYKNLLIVYSTNLENPDFPQEQKINLTKSLKNNYLDISQNYYELKAFYLKQVY